MYYINPNDDVTVAPYRRTVGHEVEYSSNPEVADVLRRKGYGTPRLPGGYQLHGPGCSCDQTDNYPVHTTSDATAGGGEYLIGGSQGVLYGSPRYVEATRVLSECANEAGCGTTTSVGMHTHVGASDLTPGQKILLLRAYLRYEADIRLLAAGPLHKQRDTGYAPSKLTVSYDVHPRSSFWELPEDALGEGFNFPGRPCLNFHGKGQGKTIEFRIWNSTKAQWRMILAGAVSSALVEAAAQNRKAHHDNPAPMTEFLKGLLTPDILLLIERQRKKPHAS